MTKTKIALAAALFAATGSAAFAQGNYDPNLANRYPSYAEPNTYGYVGARLQRMNSAPATSTLQSAPVRLQQHGKARLQAAPAPVLQQRDVALPSADTSERAGPFWYGGSGPTSGGM
jgi:hypothetical protein